MATKSAAGVKITPLSDRVVVKASEDAEQMRGGLYIPDTAKEKLEINLCGPSRGPEQVPVWRLRSHSTVR
jgi:chaperonin GroES